MADYAPGFVPDAAPKKTAYADGFVPDGAGAAPSQEKGWYQRIAEPVTKAVSRVADGLTEPFVAASRVLQHGEPVDQVMHSYSPKGSPSRYDTPALRAADVEARSEARTNPLAGIVPQTTAQAGAMGATLAAGPLVAALTKVGVPLAALVRHPALTRIGAGGAGGGVGGGVSGNAPLNSAFEGAAEGAAGAVLGEGVGAGIGFLRRGGVGAKAAINEQQNQGMLDVFRRVSPVLADEMEAGGRAVSPYLRSGKTAAGMQEAALGEGGKDALGGVMERGLDAVGQRFINGPNLRAAYDMLPQPAKDKVIGPVHAYGFTPRQAQEVVAYIGNKAFTQSALNNGIDDVALQRVWEDALGDFVGNLGGKLNKYAGPNPPAAQALLDARGEYAGGNAILEMLRGHPAFQGAPNQIFTNIRALQQYVSQHRADLRNKLGTENFNGLWESLGRGGQLGTQDIATPGTANAGSALRQVYGRGQGGAPQIVGSAARTALPNMGFEPTGRAPMQLPDMLQAILDAVGQRGVSAVAGERR